jgi:hypothetical protein
MRSKATYVNENSRSRKGASRVALLTPKNVALGPSSRLKNVALNPQKRCFASEKGGLKNVALALKSRVAKQKERIKER